MRRFGLVMVVSLGAVVSAACGANDPVAVVEASGQPDSTPTLALENPAPEDRGVADDPADLAETQSTSTTLAAGSDSSISYFPDPDDDYDLDADNVVLPDNMDELFDRLIAPEDLAPLHPLLTSFMDSTISVHPPASLARDGGPGVDLARRCGEVPEGLIGSAQRDLSTPGGEVRIGHYVAVFASADQASAYGRRSEDLSDECSRGYGQEPLHEFTESRFQDERGSVVLYQWVYPLADEGSLERQAQDDFFSETLGIDQLAEVAFLHQTSVLLRTDGAALSSSQLIQIGLDSFTEEEEAAILAAIDEASVGSG